MHLDFMSELLENVKQFATIENEKLPSGLTEETVAATMRTRAERSRVLMADTNRLIDKYMKPVFEDPILLSDDEADAYASLADALADQSTPIDVGLSYPLHEALLRRARHLRDVDRTIYHLYHCGFINLQWSMNLFSGEAVEQYEEAIGYLDGYFSIESKKTRQLLNRCLANHYVSIGTQRRIDPDYTRFFAAVDKATKFWNDPDVRAFDPDFPWDSYVNNSHQNICSWLDRLRTNCKGDKYLARRVYSSTKALYGIDLVDSSANAHSWPNARTAYVVLAAKYHMGLIPARKMVDVLRQMYDEVDVNDYSPDSLFRMLHVSAYIYEYMQEIPGIPQAAVRAEEKAIRARVRAYYNALPADMSRFTINRSSAYYMTGLMNGHDLEDDIQFLLELTTFNHMPTHVHSIMTGWLMEAIANHFIQHDPGQLTGVFDGIDTIDDVHKEKSRILSHLRLAGLAHDAGKFIYIQTFSLFSRKLTDREFQIIKEHTGEGSKMVDDITTQDACIHDVIRGHHKWYNGAGGYPAEFDNTASRYRFIIDIASVADSIDAATDNIGRCYANQKTLHSVIAEITSLAGTRYNPDIANALQDETLQRTLSDILLRQRRKAYFSVYESVHGNNRNAEAESGQ